MSSLQPAAASAPVAASGREGQGEGCGERPDEGDRDEDASCVHARVFPAGMNAKPGGQTGRSTSRVRNRPWWVGLGDTITEVRMKDDDDVARNSGAVHRRDLARVVQLLVVVLLVGALVAVALDNRNDVRIGYVVGDATGPIWLVILVAGLGGLVVGWLVRHRPRSRE